MCIGFLSSVFCSKDYIRTENRFSTPIISLQYKELDK